MTTKLACVVLALFMFSGIFVGCASMEKALDNIISSPVMRDLALRAVVAEYCKRSPESAPKIRKTATEVYAMASIASNPETVFNYINKEIEDANVTVESRNLIAALASWIVADFNEQVKEYSLSDDEAILLIAKMAESVIEVTSIYIE